MMEKLEKIERILLGVKKDKWNEKDEIGLVEKVDKIYEMYNKGMTIKEFIFLLGKLTIGMGMFLGATTAVMAFIRSHS